MNSAAQTEANAPAANAPTARLEWIDGLRGIAVAMVVCFHAVVWGGFPTEGPRPHYWLDGEIPLELGFLRHLWSLGGAGVDLFLAISGFCLFWPLVKGGAPRASALRVGAYGWRRIRRIAPPYYFGLTTVLAVSYATWLLQGDSWWPWSPNSFQNAFPWNGADAWGNLAAHLLLIHGFFDNYINAWEGAYWSLSLEWQFYFLFLPLAWVAHRWGVLWAALIPLLVSTLFRILCPLFAPDFLQTAVGTSFSLTRWVEFGGGMMAAAIVSGSLPSKLTRAFAPLQSLRPFYLILSVALALFCEYFRSMPAILPFVWGNASLALLIAGAQSDAIRHILHWRPLVGLGTISYSLYLTHGAVYMALATFLSRTEISRDARQMIYLLAAPWLAILFAAIFFRAFERPFLSGVTRSKKTGQLKSTETVRDQAAP